MNHWRARNRGGTTLVEVLLAVGVIAILIALISTALSRAKTTALSAVACSRVREQGIALVQYSSGNRELPPVFFRPSPASAFGFDQTFTIDGITVPGSWWNNGDYFFLAISPPLPMDTLLAPGEPPTYAGTYNGGPSRIRASYRLTQTLFADATFWSRNGRFRTDGWVAQRLSDIALPSSKGLIRQMGIWHDSRLGPAYPVCCTDQSTASAVLWSDLSASMVVQARLRPGIANPFESGPGPLIAWAPGIPIDETENGIRGRDR